MDIPNMSKRQEILEAAIREVTTVKEDAYGKPEDSFSLIADLWTIYLQNTRINKAGKGFAIDGSDVAMMMILLKIAREMAKHKEDNLVDIAGYAACAAEVVDGKPIPF